LLVDDEPGMLRYIKTLLEVDNYNVETATTGEEALQKIDKGLEPDLVLLDVLMPGIDGLQTLEQLRQKQPSAKVVMLSCVSDTRKVVQAMKLGAQDYLTKPFQKAELDAVVDLSLGQGKQTYSGEVEELAEDVFFIAASPAMRKIRSQAALVANVDIPVLLLGESGTGKEVLAKAIHYHSPRAQGQMLELNCAAIPDTLLESELFGYEPGAFTDARRRKEGLLERASHGTLFLDEIGDMSMSTQAKLLRVLEEGSFTRLGGTRPISVDVRIIAATNKDVKAAVAAGRFREDLFYRLNVVPLTIPPLRERTEDIVPLALEILQRFNRELKKNFTGLTPAAAELLNRYPWPGNIRELKNVIERTMILAPEGDIDAAFLPEEIRDYIAEVAASPLSHIEELSPTGDQFVTLRELEERYIDEVLTASGQNKTQAAHILGIHPTSLLRRLKKQHEDN
jgi:two-component system, NtrC family, response regulator AtoC